MAARVARTMAAVCVGLSWLAWVSWPERPRIAGGVVGGGVLVGLSAWAIRGVVDGLLAPAETKPSPMVLLVKFFTRHAILAVAAYGMMVRLHLDPVGMLVGVSSLVVAAGVEALRRVQRAS